MALVPIIQPPIMNFLTTKEERLIKMPQLRPVKKIEKIWVTGDNPRSSHALMNGETVPVGEAFSNGAFWPGDDNLEPDESCYCNCTTVVIIT